MLNGTQRQPKSSVCELEIPGSASACHCQHDIIPAGTARPVCKLPLNWRTTEFICPTCTIYVQELQGTCGAHSSISAPSMCLRGSLQPHTAQKHSGTWEGKTSYVSSSITSTAKPTEFALQANKGELRVINNKLSHARNAAGQPISMITYSAPRCLSYVGRCSSCLTSSLWNVFCKCFNKL